MSALLFYLLKASITLAGLYLVFWLFLRKDTFHQWKRFVLLANLLLSLVLPLVPVPSLSLSRAAPNQTLQYLSLTEPAPFVINVLQAEVAVSENVVNGAEIAGFLYIGLVLVLLVRFLLQLFSIYTLIRKARVIRHGPFVMAYAAKAGSPFSFLHYIILNPELYDPEILSHILAHEQVHIRQQHTLDRLLSEVYTIFFWFNPFAWLHQNLLILNLEHMADQAVLQAGICAENYQMNLLKLTLSGRNLRLTNHFNQSRLLNRIRMMNKPSSPLRFRLKIAFIVPVLTGFVLLFHGTQAKKAESHINYLSNPSPVQQEQKINKENIPAPLLSGKKQANALQNKTTQPVINRVITGTVKDAYTDKPIPSGVVISVKSKTTTVLSDKDGRFAIEINEGDRVLVFEYVGYHTTEMAITSQNEMIVLLSSAEKPVAKSNYTYLYADEVQINANDLTDFSKGNTEIRGQKIVIKSDSTDSPAHTIMYLIDGKVVDKAQLNKIKGEEIATINVYKDANSLRKFGAEDKKGVIEIKLKK